MKHYESVGGGKGIEETSKSLQEKVTAMNEPIRSLLEHTGSEGRDASYRSVLGVCRNISGRIEMFEKSLYTQKHAYYFRRVREWHDYNAVR